ncbi:MAG: LamG-like jellyroll fold domain-containing protein [Planctomycetota bacterium]
MDPKALIQDYLDGELTTEQFTWLSDWLSEDEGNREAFIRAAFFDTHLHRELTQSDLNRFMKDVDLHTLQASGGQADTEPGLSFLDAPSFVQDEPEDEPITAGRLFVLAGYLAANQLRARAGLISAFAAIIVLGLVLFIVLTGPDETANTPEIADNTPKDNSDLGITNPPPIVATLTAERDAVWKQPGGGHRPGALRQGTQLSAGQRLVLAQGFAEITTASGAVAILEAPATIELTDNNNAVYLSSGKLVGRCETPSSKGFTVSTPSAQIIDIGTEFGVEVNEQGETLTHVFQGEVEVRSVANSTAEPVRLVTDQAVAVGSGGKARIVDAAPQRFARAVPSTQYQSAILASRPMCYWRGPIEEDTRLVLDNGWLGAHGQASGSLLNHPAGYATEDTSGSLGYRSDGPTSSVTVPYRDEFGFNKGFSISAWCWIEPGHQDVMRILSTRVEGGGIGLGVIGRGDKATGGLPASAPILTLFGKSDIVAAKAMPEAQWTHLMVTVSQADQVRIYIDGEEVQAHTIPHARDAGQTGDADTQPLMIGRNPFTGQGVQAWEGRLDEIAIFDRVLPLNEIRTHLSTTNQAP